MGKLERLLESRQQGGLRRHGEGGCHRRLVLGKKLGQFGQGGVVFGRGDNRTGGLLMNCGRSVILSSTLLLGNSWILPLDRRGLILAE